MLWSITAVTFLATFGILWALFYAFAPGGSVIARRLSQLVNPSAPVEEVSFAEKQKDRASEALARGEVVGLQVRGGLGAPAKRREEPRRLLEAVS